MSAEILHAKTTDQIRKALE